MPETTDIQLPEQPGLPDAEARARALDPAGSFIVQAPAGSGKTGLLTQRFLRLLATVDHPEEIVAITFTRKAAGEMRSRIAEALRRAQGAEPEAAHEQVTWRLARAALERDRARGWHLIDHPNRLRIQTFDAYCASLTRQMPVLAQFGAQPAISGDAGALYRDAARRTLAALEGQGWSEAVARLLRHVDNDLGKVEELLVDQLGRREQWLPHLAAHRADPAGARAALEAALARTVSDGLARARAAVPFGTGRELMALARFAAENLAAAGSDSPVTRLAAAGDELPGTDPIDRPQWEALAELLLTREGGWRKTINKTNGFPAAKDAPAGQGEAFKQSKAAMGELLATLAEHTPELAPRLHAVRELPAPAYGEDQWAVLAALTEVLPLAAAQLSVVFGESGEIDFTGVALAAREALGEPEAPTDLALALDYRIRHLLVDEFQDTSTLQMDLLQRLTAGWAPGDGRSLFLVGDPMQSIYRFRDAEVGLFLRAREQGLPGLPLAPLRLEANFRSRPAVVGWVNRAFPHVLALEEDIARGAVPYAPAQAVRDTAGGAGVTVHPFLARDDAAEAERVVALLRDAGAGEAETSAAVLVRSRNHLAALIPRLREAGIPFEAVEIERLGHRPVIQDLLALTRALVHPADRPAWLAVLRAPWCGLTLGDLHHLAGDDAGAPLWQRLDDPAVRAGLSADGRERLERVRAVLAPVVAARHRGPLRRRVEGAWRALGGPGAVDRPEDLDDAATFLDLVAELEAGGDLADPDDLAARTAALFAQPDSGGAGAVQLMTIHKAKGLEFDTVIVPGLGRPPGNPTVKPLLRHLERPRPDGGADLLLAPVHAAGADGDATYAHLEAVDKEKEANENARLLYVAATRAMHHLHLLGHTGCKPGKEGVEPKPPRKGALLQTLWPAVAEEFAEAAAELDPEALEEGEASGEEAAAEVPPLRRFPAGWTVPEAPGEVHPAHAVEAPGAPSGETEVLPDFRAGATARRVGTLVHRLLRVVAVQGPEAWDEAAIAARRDWIAAELTALGVADAELDTATERVSQALRTTLADARGRWLLDPGHAEAACEQPVSGEVDGALVNGVIDRTFVDGEGTRWIVDYKTGYHEGGDPEAFLDEEQARYADQLAGYAALYRGLEARPVTLALYFPLLGAWRVWPAQ